MMFGAAHVYPTREVSIASCPLLYLSSILRNSVPKPGQVNSLAVRALCVVLYVHTCKSKSIVRFYVKGREDIPRKMLSFFLSQLIKTPHLHTRSHGHKHRHDSPHHRGHRHSHRVRFYG